MFTHTPILAILACLVAATMWGVLWYPLRVLEKMGLPGVWASLVIYIFALIVISPLVYKQNRNWPRQTGLMILLAIAAGWTNLAFILAMLEGTVVRILLLFYLSPVWAVLLAKFFLHETITPSAYANLSLALIGAIVLLWNPGLQFAVHKADLLAITSGFAFAVTNVTVRKMGDIPLLFKMSSAFTGVIILSLICILLTASPVPELNANTVLLAAAVGIFGMIAMTYTAQYAVTHLPLHQSATLFLFEVPVGAISAALLSHESMTGQIWFGGILVMLAAWLSSRNTIRHSRKQAN